MQFKQTELTKSSKHSNLIKSYNQTKPFEIYADCLKEISVFEPIKVCKEHREQILFCCFDCKDICCCNKCVTNGKHKNHDIKNLHRGYVLVQTCLNEFLIRFTTKIDLYSHLHEKLNIGKSEIIEDFAQLKNKINESFQQIKYHLELKNKQILDNIDEKRKQRQLQVCQVLTSIREKMKLCLDSHQILQHKIKQLNQISLCKYYSDKKDLFQHLLRVNSEDHYKQVNKRQQLNIKNERFDQIIKNIQQLNVLYVMETKKRSQNIKSSVDIRFYKQKQKELTTSKVQKNEEQLSPIYEINRKNMQRQSHPVLLFTPKQLLVDFKKQKEESSAKYNTKARELFVCQLKQSRKTHKMFSMPSSPLKDKKQSALHILEQQKQFFKMGKRQI